jgi:hypothetical protein
LFGCPRARLRSRLGSVACTTAATEAVAGRVQEIQEAVFASPATVYALLAWDGAALAVGLTADERLRDLVRRASRPTGQDTVREQRQPLVTGEAALVASGRNPECGFAGWLPLAEE